MGSKSLNALHFTNSRPPKQNCVTLHATVSQSNHKWISQMNKVTNEQSHKDVQRLRNRSRTLHPHLKTNVQQSQLPLAHNWPLAQKKTTITKTQKTELE
jgi:hypothetical protein